MYFQRNCTKSNLHTPTKATMLPPSPLIAYKDDMDYIHSLNFMHNTDALLLATTEKGAVYIWDLNSHRVRHKELLGKSILSVHSFDNNILTQEKAGSIKLWSVTESTQLISKYECNGGFCKCILINNMIAVPQEDSIDLIECINWKCVKKLVPDKEKLGLIMCFEKIVLGSKTYLLAGYENGDVLLWDLACTKPYAHQKLQNQILTLTFDPITQRGICGGASDILQLFTIDKCNNITLKCEVKMTNAGCNVAKIRPDRKVLVTGGWDNRIQVFSWKTLRTLAVLKDHRGIITDVQFSNGKVDSWNSNIMATSGGDGVIRLWDLYN